MSSTESNRESRRKFITHGAAAVGGVVVGLAGGYALAQSAAPAPPPVTPVTAVTEVRTTGAALGEPIRIGAIGDMRGIVGPRLIKTVQLAASEVNQAGGVVVNGQRHMFEVSVEDDKDEQTSLVPSDVVTAATKLIVDDKTSAIFGGMYSATGYIPDVAAQYHTIYIAGAGGSLDHSKISPTNKYKVVFEPQIDVIGWGTVQAHATVYIAKKYGAKKIAMVQEDQIACHKHAAVMKDYASQFGMEVDPELYFPPTRTGSFSPEIAKIRESGAPVTFIQYWTVDPTSLLEEWKNTKLKTFFSCVLASSASDPTLGERTKGLYDYIFNLEGMGKNAITSMTVPFYDAYDKFVGGNPTLNDANLYCGVHMYADAIQKAQSLDIDVICDTIHNGTWLSPLGNIKFNDQNAVNIGNIDAGEGFILLYTQWQDRKIYTVWPEKFAERPVTFPDWHMPPSS